MPASLARRLGVPLLSGSLLLTLTVCERTGPTAPDDSGPMALRVVSGDAQRATIGTELARPIVVQALNAKGKPIKSQLVNFVVVEGGGSVYAGSSITNNDGIAQEYWTLGPAVGPNKLEVRAVDPTTGEKQKFATITATGTPLPVASIEFEQLLPSVEVGGTIQLTTIVRDVAGNVVTDREIDWLSSHTSRATVVDGAVTGVAPGPVTITATSEGRSATIEVAVLRAQVVGVFVDPPSAILNIGQTRQLVAYGYGAEGQALPDRVVTWSSSSDAIATVSDNGLVTAVSDGIVAIYATVEGVTGLSQIRSQAPVASMTISPASVTVIEGHYETFTADLRDAQGNSIPWRDVFWTSSDPDRVSVLGSGPVVSVQGLVPGAPVTITATFETLSATATVTVLSLESVYPPDIYEPNDFGTSAFQLPNVIENGAPLVINPTIHTPQDNDWFRITATESGEFCSPLFAENFRLTVRISGMGGNDYDLEVRRDHPGGQVIRSTTGAADDVVIFNLTGICGGEDEFVFYVRVYPYTAFPSNTPYRLEITYTGN